MTDNATLRRLWQAYHRDRARLAEERKQIDARYMLLLQTSPLGTRISIPDMPAYPPFPDELREMSCGAKTRAGTPCKRRDLFSSGRCRLHGGLSTGPITEGGKEQSRRNGRKGGRPKKRSLNPTPRWCGLCLFSPSLPQCDLQGRSGTSTPGA